jgi:hypothetical protein
MALRLSALCAGRPLPPGRYMVLIAVGAWVGRRAIVRLQGLGKLKNPITSSGIEPATLRLVAQFLYELRYSVPPSYHYYKTLNEFCFRESFYLPSIWYFLSVQMVFCLQVLIVVKRPTKTQLHHNTPNKCVFLVSLKGIEHKFVNCFIVKVMSQKCLNVSPEVLAPSWNTCSQGTPQGRISGIICYFVSVRKLVSLHSGREKNEFVWG